MSGIAEDLARVYKLGHRNTLEAVADLDEEKMRWRPPRSNSVAFNVWHIARWADHLQSILSTMTPALEERLGAAAEVWTRDKFAGKWRLPAEMLGTVETGMGMDEDISARLALPAKEDLLAYVSRAFDAADRSVDSLQDGDLAEPARLDPARVPWLSSPSQYGNVGSWVIVSIRHESRHLGMIEALKGAAGLRGTVTR
ncbi:MAG TPA: DinB family protein [Candidatus Limnocylindria bacterium]|jgi:hypothetical protein|nr:DinB family protein [Candidatus Limnocylindria bacterium]